MPSVFWIAIIVLLLLGLWLFSQFYHRHIQGENAPERSTEVIILDKQSISVEHPLPGQEDREYWIYVQQGKLGPKREFQVGVHYFHALNPGDRGVLTYRGTQFLHFALQR
ncbi:DUF2500 domain-containing protein [Vibrio fluvialis]|uniref:DUF2500 domain-containing protein n=1 Tax=Vibrio fluvialis TaxID=676 RepID=UPI0012ADD8E4|nr:DUF2500 domain-containing protein [Vibrio fluvialis]EKO3392182.1 DUF2500 domain-containing protein [Vibrio fluvialis]EKO3466123.1 DUF2500 domain-containing protein [Vibrio fluvialis]EKO3985455.1 DUF2500 domain-containing protein [Vibrio fluvialis]EKO5152562.1 DUF2500 domain-containing protein [Vibrio fluvialis]ELO4022350.1 DUF2500 domain-containing protein [Vibrio fluvialis]